MATIPTAVTWTPGDIPDDAHFNSNIRDGINLFLTPPACRLRDTSVPDVVTLTWTLRTWGVEDADTEAMHSTGTNPSRITAVTAGRYLAYATVRWEDHNVGGNNGGLQVQIRKNSGGGTGGTLVAMHSHHGTDNLHLNPYGGVSGHVVLGVGDYLECLVRHSYNATIGSDNSMINDTDDKSSQFGAIWIAAS